MNNLLEYFAGLNPSVSNPPMRNALDASPTTLRFVFQRSNATPDLSYSYEWSPDMTNWFSPDPPHTFTETVIGGSPANPPDPDHPDRAGRNPAHLRPHPHRAELTREAATERGITTAEASAEAGHVPFRTTTGNGQLIRLDNKLILVGGVFITDVTG